MKKIAHIVAAAVGLAMSAVPAFAKSNVTEVCKDHVHEGFAEHQIHDRAFIGALQNWTAVATEHDGESWAHIDRGAPVLCQNQSKSNTDWWVCAVTFRPCRMVPTDLPAVVPTPGVKLKP